MKIAMITADYLPNIGGIASHIYELSHALAKQGHEVQVWFWDISEREAVSSEAVPTISLKPEPARYWPKGLSYSHTLAKELSKKISHFSPQILHVHTLAPLSLSMRWIGNSRHYRRIFTNHSSGYLAMMETWLGRQKAKFCCSSFDGLLAPSQELLDSSSLLGLNKDRCKYISNGVDTDKFIGDNKRSSRQQLQLPQEKLVLLATRRFAIKNGLRYLVMAIDILRHQYPNILCVFCGDAYDREEWEFIQDFIKDCSLQDFIRLEGRVKNEKIKLFLDASDLVILPSLVEATSISALEAMSMKKPIVATEVGGLVDLVVDGETGVLVKPANVTSLSDGIKRILTSFDLDTLGQAARNRAEEKFSWNRIAKNTEDFYTNILSKEPR